MNWGGDGCCFTINLIVSLFNFKLFCLGRESSGWLLLLLCGGLCSVSLPLDMIPRPVIVAYPGNSYMYSSHKTKIWTLQYLPYIMDHQNLFANIVRKMAKIKKRYNQVPHLIQDTTRESKKNTINTTNMSLEASPFPSRWPQGSNEQTWKDEKHKTQKTPMIHKESTALERSIKIFYWSA